MSEQSEDPALRWWRELQPEGKRANAAALAQLRRATTPAEALMVQAAHDLATRLGRGRADWLAVGTLAAALAHVRTHDGSRPAAAIFGEPTGGDDGRRVSALRFRRLLQANDWPERLTALRRAIALTGGRSNVADLARSLLRWNDHTRTRWMFDYFGAAPPETADGTDPTAPETA